MDHHDLQKVEALIKSYADFPKKGINFKDIHPILTNHEARDTVLKHLANRYKDKNINVIVGLESRGYYYGMLLSHELKLPFVPFRKAGKLPGPVHTIDYGLEYGKDAMQVQKSAIKKGDRVLILDDLLATGGTAAAACQLVTMCEAEIVEVSFLIELLELNGRSKAPKGVEYYALFKY